MKNVLYVGNALSSKGKTVTPIETLSEHLKEICHVKVASRRTNIVLRLLDMVILVLKHRYWADVVLIDTYSTLNFNYAVIISGICRAFKIEYIPILHGGNLENRYVVMDIIGRLKYFNASIISYILIFLS